ncbi:MAG: hypothetical protein KJ583_05480 [Nanoarchaeota archaeon]|nr:hypothetical protein [Nanoarchaeota archaeon]MBU1604742.1 hypothetical protein [Nanoarchaeota archaeon]MBU2443697.1 hypothetical protein [Nanoarchaeota archaeon]
MPHINNKVEDIYVSDVSGDKDLRVILRRSYIPFGGMVAVLDCDCGSHSKQNVLYQRVHHFKVENETLSCNCGKKVTFSYEKDNIN